MSSEDAAVNGVASNGPTVRSRGCAVGVCAGAHEADELVTVYEDSCRQSREEAGRQVVFVNAHHTSQTCSQCGHVDAANQCTQADFVCVSCSYALHADVNAAIIYGRGRSCRLRGGARHWPTPQIREVRYRRGGPGSRGTMLREGASNEGCLRPR